MLLFDRAVELTIFTSTKKFEITDLHMDFEVLLRRSSEPNIAKIGVYNLAEATRAILEEEHLAIEFKAGYGGQPNTIFMGTTSNVISVKNGPDWRTTVYAADGQKEIEKAYFDKAYSAGTPYIQIFIDIANALGLPLNPDPVLFDLLSEVLLRGRSFNGKAVRSMKKLTKDLDIDWTILFGAIELVPKNSELSTSGTATLFTFDTGMIGSPVVTFEKKKKNRRSKPAFNKSVQVTSLLNPDVKPNKLIEVLSLRQSISFGDLDSTKLPTAKADGVYICDEALFTGSNYGQEFDVKVKAIGQ